MERLAERFDLVAVGTDPGLAAVFAARGLPYRSYRMSRGVNPAADLLAMVQLVRIFRRERPSVVHTFDTKPGVWGRLAARLAGVPVIVGTLPGLGSLYTSRSVRARLLRCAYQPLQTLASRCAALTIFQNEHDAREFERRRVVSADRVAVVPGSGVRTDVFTPTAPTGERLRDDLDLGDGVVVLMVSRVMRSKGVLDFAAAARQAREVDPRIRFLLVGPEDTDSVDALTAAELAALRDSVTWLGPRTDIADVLRAADVFVFPSFYREGVPRVLLEAASAGLPLIAADVPGSRDVVQDGVNGYLVPPQRPDAIADAVLRLAGSPDLRRELGARSRERALAVFDLSLVTARIESIYHELLAARGPTAPTV
jgi:glycosyltransferase involved in cell wall biosynthesis